MPLELHVWGPAFGLPSIDAECLAAIAYLRSCLPDGEWVLVASSDPSISPTNELPVLRSGTLWISRYRNIIDYLRKFSAGEWDLDRGLSKHQRADIIAFSSFLESRGQPLLDLYLYVSSENYTTCVRSAYADILAWPTSWVTPLKLRAAAKKRSQHLGLSSLDIDTAHPVVTEESKMTAQIPKSLRKPKETVSNLLGKSTHRSQFRLDAVTSEFFEPVDELLADKEWLISERLTSLDCLAIGHLALMQAPQLPHDWLRCAMKQKYPRLGKWTSVVARSTFGRRVDARNALSPLSEDNVNEEHSLPWQAPVRPTVATIASTILETTVDALPIVGRLRANKQLRSSSEYPGLEEYERKQLAVIATNRNRDLYSQIVAAGAGIGTFVGYLFWVGVLQLPKRRDKDSGKRNFGAAGAMLGLG